MAEETEKKYAAPVRRSFAKGTTIFKEGDQADAAYILESGTVQIFKSVGGRRITLGNIGPWGIFGELGIVDEFPRMATAYAADDTVCMVITKESVEQMQHDAPPGLMVLIRSMAQTIRTAGENLAEARFLLMEKEKAEQQNS